MTLLAALATAAFAAAVVARLVGLDLVAAARRGRAAGRARAPGSAALATWLAQSGAGVTPRQFVLGSAALGSLTFVVIAALTAAPAVAVVPGLAVGALPRVWFSRRREQRLREVAEAWPDGIRDLTASISAGMSLHGALTALADTGPDALRDAFARYPAISRTHGPAAALEIIREELADPTSDRVIEVLVLASREGGDLLTRILRDLADATTRDVRTLEEIQTDALEQRINARAVLVLPWAVLVILTLQDGHFRDFYAGPGGVVTVIVGALLSIVGAVIVGRLGREPVEQRVLGRGAEVGP